MPVRTSAGSSNAAAAATGRRWSLSVAGKERQRHPEGETKPYQCPNAKEKSFITSVVVSVFLSVRQCDIGERCAMKHGPRIGRLCDCLRGTACNTFFLRCY